MGEIKAVAVEVAEVEVEDSLLIATLAINRVIGLRSVLIIKPQIIKQMWPSEAPEVNKIDLNILDLDAIQGGEPHRAKATYDDEIQSFSIHLSIYEKIYKGVQAQPDHYLV